MGTSNYRSNIRGLDGTETIANFASVTADAFVGPITGDVTGDVTGVQIRATNYVKIGSTAYLFSGSVTANSASIIADASQFVTVASLPGSLYLSQKSGVGQAWVYISSVLASSLTYNVG